MRELFVSHYNQLAFQFVHGFDFVQAPAVTVICGKEGLGKTTLLEYLQTHMYGHVKPTILLDAQKFTSKYSFASQNGELSAFRNTVRSSKLLLLDNIHTLKGKKKTIEELFHTLDTIWTQGGKTVMTYEGDPVNFAFLGERFASRLHSGFIIHLQKPTEREMNDFLSFYLSTTQLPPVFDPNLIAKATNMKQVIDYVTQQNRYPFGSFQEKVTLVLPLVCEYYGADENRILSGSKVANAVQARYMLYLLLHEIYQFSFKEIAHYFKKDRYSLSVRCQQIKENNQESFESLCQKLYNQLNILYQNGYSLT